MTSFKIKNLQAFCYRYPLATPVVTSFGRMNDRPALFVHAEDEDGQHGWGEVWCNFPPAGAEHRARLINEMLAPMFARRAIEHPSEMFDYLTAATSVMALQSGEQGPFAQPSAGADIALWDLFARRSRQPRCRRLAGRLGLEGDGGRREHRRPRCLCDRPGRRHFERGAAGCRQMGRCYWLLCRRSRGPPGEEDLLPALSRRRHRALGVRASARRQ